MAAHLARSSMQHLHTGTQAVSLACMAFVRSRQSTQFVRATPRWNTVSQPCTNRLPLSSTAPPPLSPPSQNQRSCSPWRVQVTGHTPARCGAAVRTETKKRPVRANAPSAFAPRLCANTTGRAVGGAGDADDGEKSLPADMRRFIGEAAADDSAGVSAGELGDSDAIVCIAVTIFAASFSPFTSACSTAARGTGKHGSPSVQLYSTPSTRCS